MQVYTVGFTKKTASCFFKLLNNNNNKDLIIDIRLSNTSQLSGFAKYPDIEFFINNLTGIEYKHDKFFAPTNEILHNFKKKIIDWDEYQIEFNNLMQERNIVKHILDNYSDNKNICLLCSESTSQNCHRKLVANYFENVFEDVVIIDI